VELVEEESTLVTRIAEDDDLREVAGLRMVIGEKNVVGLWKA
jgi:hypothetical protein